MGTINQDYMSQYKQSIGFTVCKNVGVTRQFSQTIPSNTMLQGGSKGFYLSPCIPLLDLNIPKLWNLTLHGTMCHIWHIPTR